MLLIPNLGLGGAQRVFHDHGVEFAKHYDVTEVVFNNEDAGVYGSGNELVSLDVSGGKDAVEKARNFGRRIGRLAKVKKQRRPDVCISHLEGADYVNVLSRGSERVVLCVHGSKMHDQNISGATGWLRRRVLIPTLYQRADVIVTVSQGIRRELIDSLGLPADKVRVINNFFANETIVVRSQEPIPAEYEQVLATHPVMVTAGRFAPEKNLLPLLDITAQVHKVLPRCKLLLIGEGAQLEELLERCRSLELSYCLPGQPLADMLQATVLFAGFQTNPHAYFARSTVFVLPSRNEGFPMALGEAMICGVAVAAADCPTGPREILAPASTTLVGTIRDADWTANGVLLPLLAPGTGYEHAVQQWTDALVKIVQEPALRTQLVQQARQRMQDFTREKIFRQWMNVIEETSAR